MKKLKIWHEEIAMYKTMLYLSFTNIILGLLNIFVFKSVPFISGVTYGINFTILVLLLVVSLVKLHNVKVKARIMKLISEMFKK